MPIPTAEQPPRLKSQDDLLRWADRIVDYLMNMRALVLPSLVKVLGNGATHNLDIGSSIILRITGPTAAFNITGASMATEGRPLFIYNSTAQAMTINHENAGSASANRFHHMNGADFVTVGEGIAGYVYNNN